MATTYTKLKDGSWGLRSDMPLKAGHTIIVIKKDGSTKAETVARQIWKGNGVYLFAIEAKARTDAYGNSISSGASYRAGVTAPHGRRCPQCGERDCSKAWNPRDLCDND